MQAKFRPVDHMSREPEFELVGGSGNVFEDLGDADAVLKHTKAVLAAEIIGMLDGSGFTVREAADATGFEAAEFSRVRNADLDRFTVDRLVRMEAALQEVVRSLANGRRTVDRPSQLTRRNAAVTRTPMATTVH